MEPTRFGTSLEKDLYYVLEKTAELSDEEDLLFYLQRIDELLILLLFFVVIPLSLQISTW